MLLTTYWLTSRKEPNMNEPELKTFQVFGHKHGYPWGFNKVIRCATIEEAHEEGELLLDEVVSVKEIAE